MQIGYARISTDDQTLDLQRRRPESEGRSETARGRRVHRPRRPRHQEDTGPVLPVEQPPVRGARRAPRPRFSERTVWYPWATPAFWLSAWYSHAVRSAIQH